MGRLLLTPVFAEGEPDAAFAEGELEAVSAGGEPEGRTQSRPRAPQEPVTTGVVASATTWPA